MNRALSLFALIVAAVLGLGMGEGEAQQGRRVALFGGFAPAVYTDFTQLGGVLPSSLYSYAGANGTYINSAGVITAATTNVARFDYDPVTLLPRGLLIEESRTNLFLNSNAPATQTITVASGSAYSISFYGTGVLTLSGALTQVMTGGAYPTRTTYTGTASTTVLVVTVTTLGTMSYPQVELGAFATSAIPTGASSVTRAADVVGIAGRALVVLLGTQGSVVGESGPSPNWASYARLIDYDGTHALLALNGGGANQWAEYNGVAQIGGVYGGGVNVSATPAFRTGLSWSTAGVTGVGAGGAVVSSSQVMPTPAGYYLGNYSAASAFYDGYIRKLVLWNVSLPNNVLRQGTLLTTVLQ